MRKTLHIRLKADGFDRCLCPGWHHRPVYPLSCGGDNAIVNAINLGANINSESHDSNLAMTADGAELYVYKGDQTGDFFITTKNNKGL